TTTNAGSRDELVIKVTPAQRHHGAGLVQAAPQAQPMLPQHQQLIGEGGAAPRAELMPVCLTPQHRPAARTPPPPTWTGQPACGGSRVQRGILGGETRLEP